ncbi:hypothetical protein PZ938_00110 [Luteipulveratus sp. YIM 133132]|uniref:hypothetical protein n=1 Tax=Luteipulveratus flavus TaxID=3031728 RepID=UPI0023B04BB1|nr:hypothetical protein [Luteipulveratus sp. YIM 133132]MDE9363997.1 hypothetical protein [Luteipulveratus sp. YIM 133132]
MTWVTDDGRHEGYLVAEFADGVRANGISGGGVPPDRVIVATTYEGDLAETIPVPQHQTRPAGQVVGWRVMCQCYAPDGPMEPVGSWMSSGLLIRVPSPTLEDLPGRRVYAADDDVVDVDDRDDVDELGRQVWRTEHADRHTLLDQLDRAVDAEREARAETDRIAREARTAGSTWEQIGRAAGITRQAAHERWSAS